MVPVRFSVGVTETESFELKTIYKKLIHTSLVSYLIKEGTGIHNYN